MSAVLAKPQVKDFLKTLAKGKEKGQEQRKEHDVNAHAVTAEGEPSKKPWEEDIPELSSPSYSPPTSFSYSSDSSSSSNPRRRNYVLGELKFGGNAQSIIKDRWLHHTSFLWDFRNFRMSYLKIPKRAPSYRAGRSHGDFICKLKDHFSSRSHFLNEVEAALLRVFDIEEVTYTDASCMGDISHKSTTKLFSQSELCCVGGEVQT
ncbi:hypothetical protein L7F22_036927 [Adiantum nelumboides]|nr:hypothetical protein [Adiantum nelumboides]